MVPWVWVSEANYTCRWPHGLAQDLIPLFSSFSFFYYLFFEHTRLRWTLVLNWGLDPTRLFHDG